MRIVEIAALVFPSHQGTQVLVHELCDLLAGAGHEVRLVTYAHGLPDFQPRYEHLRIGDWPRLRSMRSGLLWQKPLLDLRLARALSRMDADVFHAHGPEALLAALVARRAPILYQLHTRFDAELPSYGGDVFGALAGLGRLLDRALPAMAAHCAAVTSDLVPIAGGSERCTVVPPAIRTPAAPNVAPTRGLVGYAGNLDGYQGWELLVDAIADLPRARLRVITASSPGALLARARRRGIADRVEILSHADFDTVLAQLADCEVLALPRATPGGFPMKLLAYLATQRPVVAVDHAANGAPVLRVANNARAFAHGIRDLFTDRALAERLGIAGRGHLARAHGGPAALAAIDFALAATVRGKRTGASVTAAARSPTIESTRRDR